MARRFHRTLYFWVLLAIGLGIVLGALAPDVGARLKVLSDAFIALVTMTIGPLIFCTVVVGIAGSHHMKDVGKAGGLAILYFELATTVALAIGLVIVNIVEPGADVPAKLDPAAAEAARGTAHGASHWLVEMIPDLGGHHVLSVLIVAILFGIALHGAGERGKPITDAIDRIGHVVFRVVAIIMLAAPLGAFGAMAFTIGKFGAGTLRELATLMACFYATCLIFLFGVLGIVAKLHGFSVFRFVRYIREELLIVLGTSSSESVLPRMIDKLERLGADKPVVGLVVPAGYSFNLDGTAIYVTMGAIFVAQATHTPMTLGQQIGLLALAMVTSKGAAGVTGAGLAALVATLDQFHDIPAAGIAIVVGIDRFMSEARALTNVIGNGVATLVVARWCKALDRDKLAAELHPKS